MQDRNRPPAGIVRGRKENNMIFYTMKRSNGDTALVRSCGNKYAADVTSHTGDSDNANWPELYDSPIECRKALEKWGFKIG